jgi:hypothetical protein
MTLAVSIAQGGSNNVTMRNRIINGSMVIDQRNAGATVTSLNGNSGSYFLDRWQGYCSNNSTGNASIGQSSVAPSGFANSLLVTVTAAQASLGANFYSMVWQKVEGYNSADLNWGASQAAAGQTAKPITISFWVRSSVAGAFGGSILNSAQDRCFPFSYTINSINTWEQKTVTITGDTSGSWLTTNGTGLIVGFGLGVGSTYGSGTAGAWSATASYSTAGATNLYATNGNTFYITGVQLEAGTTATPFENRLYGTELYLCQRYFWPFIFGDGGGQTPGPVGWGESTSSIIVALQYPQSMRATPSISTTNAAADFRVRYGSGSIACNVVPSGVNINTMATWLIGSVASGITVNNVYALSGNTSNVKLNFSAEL